MKNPFIKEDDSTAWTVALLLGTVAAGLITYWVIRRNKEVEEAAKHLKGHSANYLKPKPKKSTKQTYTSWKT